MSTSPPRWLWIASIPLVAAIVLFGVWVTGAMVTNDETIAKGLTGVWFIVAGLMAVIIGWRWHGLAVPVIGTFVVVAGVAGGFLLYTSTVDTVVDEQVVVADPGATEPEAAEPTESAASGSGTEGPPSEPKSNVEVASGQFEADAHPTSGAARVIDTVDGDRVLTLTGFSTDPGPDLRVYVVPKGASGVEGGVDLGALKGNRGDQQYDVPKGTDPGTVVIWCRAFSVAFGSAALR